MGCTQTKQPHAADIIHEKVVMDSNGNEIQDVSPCIDDILNKINKSQYEHVDCKWQILDIVSKPKKNSIIHTNSD